MSGLYQHVLSIVYSINLHLYWVNYSQYGISCQSLKAAFCLKSDAFYRVNKALIGEAVPVEKESHDPYLVGLIIDSSPLKLKVPAILYVQQANTNIVKI